MKKLLLTGTLTFVAIGAALGGACIASDSCRGKSGSSAATEPVNGTTTEFTSQQTASKTKAPQAIKWYTSLDSALAESKRTGKPVFADFYADWCPPCKLLESKTYPNPKVIAESQRWVMLKIDTEKQKDLAAKYRIFSLPTLAVMRADGKPVTGTTGFLDADDFVLFLRDVYKQVAPKQK
jgi:thioredoxin 1